MAIEKIEVFKTSNIDKLFHTLNEAKLSVLIKNSKVYQKIRRL